MHEIILRTKVRSAFSVWEGTLQPTVTVMVVNKDRVTNNVTTLTCKNLFYFTWICKRITRILKAVIKKNVFT